MEADRTNGKGTLLKAMVLGALIAGGVGIIILLQSQNPSSQAPIVPTAAIGEPAPAFTLPNLDHEMVSLADFKGKVVLLNIWATWCPPCVEEMPSMQKLHQTLQGEGLEILAVSIDSDGAKAVAPFMAEHKLSFPALIDNQGLMKRLYRPTGVPESHIIDRSGNVGEKVIGPRDWASPDALRYFRELLKVD
jgi:peroxiredoxin